MAAEGDKPQVRHPGTKDTLNEQVNVCYATDK